MTRFAPVSSPTFPLPSHPVQPTVTGAPHAAQPPSPRTAGVFRASLRINEFCRNYAKGRCRFTAEDCDRIHAIPDSAPAPQQRHAIYPSSVSPAFVIAPSTGTAQEPCRDFLRGRCTRRPCRYSHSEHRAPMHPVDPRASSQPQRYYNPQPPTRYFNHRPVEDFPPPSSAKRYRPETLPLQPRLQVPHLLITTSPRQQPARVVSSFSLRAPKLPAPSKKCRL